MAKAKNDGESVQLEDAPKRRRGRQPAPIDPETGEKVKMVKHPVPDGYDVPADFYIYVSFNKITDAGNPTVYSWIRGANAQPVLDAEGNAVFNEDGSQKMTEPNGFPAYTHTDGRTIVDRAAGIEWIKNHEAAKAERDALKAQRELNASVRMRNSAIRLAGIMARSVSATTGSGE